jgi:hypothetical protein
MSRAKDLLERYEYLLTLQRRLEAARDIAKGYSFTYQDDKDAADGLDKVAVYIDHAASTLDSLIRSKAGQK